MTDRWCLAQVFTGSVAPRMGVAEPLRRPTTFGGERDLGLVGTIRAACRRSRLRVNSFPFWLLFSGVWETLIFGTGTPTYPLPGHRLVPESQSVQSCPFPAGDIRAQSYKGSRSASSGTLWRLVCCLPDP